MLIITCDIIMFLLTFLCSYFILVHQEITKIIARISKTLDVGGLLDENPYIGEKPVSKSSFNGLMR